MNDEDFVAKVKEASPIEDVIEGCGFAFQRKAGRYLHASEHDSLVVDTYKQAWWWNSKGADWCGDVIRWIEKFRNVEFKSAVEILAERAKLPVKWAHVDEGRLKVTRAREDCWTVACRVWQEWLWKDEEALGYCRERGWSDEVIRESGVGFTGRRTDLEYREMKGELSLNGIDLESPQAVCVVGFRPHPQPLSTSGEGGGGREHSASIREWGERWDVEVDGELWLEWGMIPGAMGKMRVVYPHWVGGRIRYFSTRRVLGDREFEEATSPPGPLSTSGEGGKPQRKEIKKSWNPPVKLAGERQVYLNQEWRREAESAVVVEGPADAISLGQWGLAGLALCGLGGSESGMEGVRRLVEKCKAVYVALDADEAGKGSAQAVAGRLGPMVRLVDVGRVR